jgi:predicted RNase H-like HicB family nuclease
LKADRLLIDEREGRAMARQLGLSLTGVLGVLLRGKRLGQVEAIAPELKALRSKAKVKGCHSYGRTIQQARERIREAPGLYVDDAEAAEIEDDVRMPAAVKLAVRNAHQMRQQLEKARARVNAAESRAVQRLRIHMKLGHREDALLKFLDTLQVLPPGTKALVVDENYQAKTWPGPRP